MDIILGVHKNPYWRNMLLSNNWECYPFNALDVNIKLHSDVIEVVETAIKRCDHIHFILDGVRLPIDPVDSVTCKELALIIRHYEYFDKTTFYFRKHIVDKKKVAKYIHLSIDGEGNPLKFSSLLTRDYVSIKDTSH